jgi:hypothetical protein
LPPRRTGTVEAHRWADGGTVSYRARVRAYGRRHRLTFGTTHKGWSLERGQVELERIIGQVERGTWGPPDRAAPPMADTDETGHVTASRWWQRRQDELAPNTRASYRYQLDHLIRHFAHDRTGDLNFRRVDWFRDRLKAASLSARHVNLILDLLAQVCDDAVEYGLLGANPTRGRRRRVRVPKRPRRFLEARHGRGLLDVAGDWEGRLPWHQRYGRRALLATLCLAGPRMSELTARRAPSWTCTAAGSRVGEARSEAGLRDLELTMFLLGELRAHPAALPDHLLDRGPTLPVFPTWGAAAQSVERPDPAARGVCRACERPAGEGRQDAAARPGDAAGAPQHVRQPPRWPRAATQVGDGLARPHRRRPDAERVRPGGATKRQDERQIRELMRFPDEEQTHDHVAAEAERREL